MNQVKRLLLVVFGMLACGVSSVRAEEVLHSFGRSDGKWGYVNSDHCWAINPQFDFASGFDEGLAPVQIGGKWGFIDKTGRMAINPEFDMARLFSDGLAPVQIGGKWGFIDKTGRWLLDPTCSVSRQVNRPGFVGGSNS